MWNNKAAFVKTSMAGLSHTHSTAAREQIPKLLYCFLLKDERPFPSLQISILEPDVTWPVLT